MLLSSLVSQQTALRSIHAFSLGSISAIQASVVLEDILVRSTGRMARPSDLVIDVL